MINLIKKLISGKKSEEKSKINLKKSSKNDTEYSSFSGNHIHGNVIVSGGGKVVINGKEIIQGKSLGPYISQNREVKNFNKLDLSGVVNVIFKQSDEYSLVVQAEESVISQVITNVKNETLYISIDGNFFSKKSVNVTINAPEIVFVKQSGVTSFEAYNLESEFLEFKFKSTGKATLSGSINSANFSIDGVGNFDAKKLVTNSLKVDASGVGTIYLHATESITGSLNGVGDRHIYGNPRIAGLKTGGVGTTKHH